MIRLIIAAWLMLVSASVAQTKPAATTTASMPSADELHRLAVERMKAGDYKEARELLDKLYRVVPPQQRTRSMVLNRAIADMGQRTLVMRALRELGQYLTEHPEDDELATNVLAGALNLAADEPRLKRGALWQAAYAEWARRNEILDRSRPGFRRWGAEWVTDEQYEQIKAQQREFQQAVKLQQDRVADARSRITAVEARAVEGVGPVMVENDPFAPSPIYPLNPTAQERQKYEQLLKTDWDAAKKFYKDFERRQQKAEQPQINREQRKEWERDMRQDRAERAFDRETRKHMSEAQAQLAFELRELRSLVQHQPRPLWPDQFDPIEP